MLGTLAGISITFISMLPAAQMWALAWIALPVFALLLIGLLTDIKLPFNFPIGLAALLIGTAIALDRRRDVRARRVGTAAKDIAIAIPTFHLAPALHRTVPCRPHCWPRPSRSGVYNFTEGMSNVESAAAAGDSYNLRSVLLADGIGAVVGSALGSPFPPAVYIGHPGWKKAGGRTGYSMATGVVIALLCFLGLFGLLGALFPLPAIVPILLYIGLLIGAQAFQYTPRVHAAAVIAALIPNIASWASGLIDNALGAAGTNAAAVGETALENAGVVYNGLTTLGEGAILAGLLLGAIVAFIIDKRLISAAAFAGVAAVLSFVGLIHAPKVGWNADGPVALGYLFMAVVLLLFALTRPTPRVPDADELALDAVHGGSTKPAPAILETEPVAPVTEEPVVVEPVAVEPVVVEPVADEPVVDEPAAAPVAEQPAAI